MVGCAQHLGSAQHHFSTPRRLTIWLLSLYCIPSHGGSCRFSNVVSFSDGALGNNTGTPYFYLTPLDPSAADVAADPRASLAVSAMPLGTCDDADPESPLCAKLTLSGELHRVLDPEELSFAEHALFTRHPEMQTWPKDHNFHVFKLVLANVFLINGFGGPRHITLEQYYSASSDIPVSKLTV
ncbi:unnamed protein product [Closterium sp. NIES-64]|nr:unnamed protein product [Closterium sp. NIES-64]